MAFVFIFFLFASFSLFFFRHFHLIDIYEHSIAYKARKFKNRNLNKILKLKNKTLSLLKTIDGREKMRKKGRRKIIVYLFFRSCD
jgi:hypothetical protein